MKHWKSVTLLSVAAAVVLWQALPIRAFNPQPEPPGRYLQSILPDEGVRVHLLFAPLLRTMTKCEGKVSFLNLETGAEAAPARAFSLAPEKGMVITVTPDARPTGAAGEIAPMGIEPVPWRIEVSANPAACAIASLDVFDVATGHTLTTVRY